MAERLVTIERYSSRTFDSLSGVCTGRSRKKRTIEAARQRTPTIATETRQLVASATIPAIGMPTIDAIVFIPMTVAMARARSE